MVSFLQGVTEATQPPRKRESAANLTNNPGAIEDGDFARGQAGYKGSDGRFAIFDTPENGSKAQRALMDSPNYKGKSPAEIIQRWAPLSAENTEEELRNYIGYVAARAGIDPDKPIPPEKMEAYQSAQREFETGNRPAVEFQPYKGTIAARGSAKGKGGVSSSSVPEIPDVTTIQATDAERTAMGQPRDQVVSPFDPAVSERLRTGTAKEQERLSFADSLLQRVTAESTEIRDGLEQDLAQVVDAKKAINDQTRSHLDSLAAVAQPVWEKRTALATQLLALDEMNPLEQGLRSMFDPNYNRRALRGEIRSQEAALAELNSVFTERYQHSQILTALATADYNDTEALANLMLQNGGEDVRLALQSFNLAGTQVDTVLKELGTESALIASRQQARSDVLAGLTPGQVNAGLADASASPTGMTEINGIPIRAGELQEAQTRLQSQMLSMANAKIAIQQGNNELAEMNKKNVIETMTIADVKSAIQNDGEFNGVQFDLPKLAERLQTLQQSNQVIASQAAMETVPGITTSVLNQIAATDRMQTLRFTSLFGQVPGEMTQFTQAFRAQMATFQEGLATAKSLGTVNEYLASQMPALQASITAQQKVVETTVTRWAGGNKDIKAVGMAWMTGQPVDAASSVRAFVHFARNGIPAGTKFVGAASQLLQIAQEEVEAADRPPTQGGSPSIEAMLQTPEGKAEREAALVQRIQRRAAETYNGAMGLELYSSIPQIAGELDLPFKRITPEQWTNATAYGDQRGAEVAGNGLNMSGPDFEAMLIAGPDGPVWQSRVKGLTGAEANFSYWQDSLTVSQIQAMMQHLDSHAGGTGFVPSFELSKVVAHPNFMVFARNGESGSSNMSFGGFLANSAGGGNFLQNAEAQASLITNAYRSHSAAMTETRVRRINSLAANPVERARFILGAIPEMAPSQEQVLLREITRLAGPAVAQTANVAAVAGPEFASPWGDTPQDIDAVNRTIDAFIQSGSSDDPAVKAALSLARTHWSKIAIPITTAIQRDSMRGNR